MDEDHFTDMEDSFTESDETSWGDKIGGSIVGVVLGVVLFFGSFPFLFWNEGRAVDRYKLLKEGESVVVSISSDRVDPAHEGRLVHASGRAETEEILEDPELGVSALAVKLERNVEMYQWREKKKKKDKKTTYSYSKTWSSSLIDSSSFRRSDSHRNPGSMPFQSREFVADNVTLGEFTLSGSLIRKIDDARPLAVDRAESLPEALGDEGDFYGQGFYIGQDPDSPRIGDVRITFRVVRPTEVSLVAKQTGDSFAAYRTESGGSIELLEIGALDARGMFKSAHQSNTILTWALRIGGAIAMLIGLFLIFGPLSALADIIPFLGGVVQFGAVIVALLLTCVLSTLTIGAAWVFYRPVLGISLLVFGVALTAVIIKLGAGRGKSKAAPRPARMTGAPTPPPPAAEGAAPSPPPASPLPVSPPPDPRPLLPAHPRVRRTP
ncbi:MAG: hypothetical protein GY859_21700 [Desulfobacterales bacterium]|nr:hypothetical protein [Desulfobacterales bacterium]